MIYEIKLSSTEDVVKVHVELSPREVIAVKKVVALLAAASDGASVRLEMRRIYDEASEEWGSER